MAVNEFSNETMWVKKQSKNIDHGFYDTELTVHKVDHHDSKRIFKQGLAGKKAVKK